VSKRLIISDGKRERSLVLFDKLIVGRDPACDVTHEDDLLSRRHAEFVASADTVTVRDLGSRNGIYVNGLKTAERPIYPGDVVQIGPLRILYAHHVPPAGIVPEYVVPDRAMPGQRPSTPRLIPMQSSSPPTPWPPPSPPTPVPAPPTPVAAKPTAADEEQTQVLTPVNPIASPSTPTSPVQTPAATHSFQDGPTQFIAPPQASAAASPSATRITPAATPAATPRPAPAAAPAAAATPPRPAQPPASPPAKSEPSLEPPPTVELTIDQTRLAPVRPPARSVDSDLKGYVFGQSTAIAVVALLSAIVPLSLVRADALGAWLAISVVLTIATTYLVARSINRRFARIVRALKPDGALGGEPSRGSRGSSSDLFRS
jgi:hypothetical protein